MRQILSFQAATLGVFPAVREAVHGVPPAVPHDGLGLRLRPERGRGLQN